MLEEMAKNLGYKNISWDKIDESYYPKFLSGEYQRTIEMGELVNSVSNFFDTHSKSQFPTKNRKQKNKKKLRIKNKYKERNL